MSKLKWVWFGFSLAMSIILVAMCFEYADRMRGFEGTGSEVFMIALPMWLVYRKMSDIGQNMKRLTRLNKALLKNM